MSRELNQARSEAAPERLREPKRFYHLSCRACAIGIAWAAAPYDERNELGLAPLRPTQVQALEVFFATHMGHDLESGIMQCDM